MKQDKKIAIIGGGPMGLAVAYEFSLKGYKTTIFEADDRLGGMAACFDFDGLMIERYYHFHCLNDLDFFTILEEIGLDKELVWKKTKMGFFYNDKLYKWGSLASVLFFRRISFFIRIRYLLHAARCLTIKNWRNLDHITAVDWLKKWLGEKGYRVLWEKLFEYKFYNYSNEISAAWIWSRIRRLGQSRENFVENLGFLRNGSIQLIDELEKLLILRGTDIKLSNPVINIKPNKKSGAIITTSKEKDSFDLVVSTIPLPLIGEIFSRSEINNSIISKYQNLKYVSCACVILKTRKKITNNFWTNINDSRFSIPGIIEISNLRNLSEHITYIPYYMPENHPDYSRHDDLFKSEAWNCVKSINKNLKDDDLIIAKCNRYRFAQPVCGTNYKETLPKKEPFTGFFTVDTSAYYPEDRGISESVKFGRNLVRKILYNKKIL
tara:strand:+ start:121 stop:1428 length:1308 start_codon:yes stop_codon:yes gene_type:complete